MSETKRTKNIAFRLTDEEYAQIDRAATASGDDPNTWCRKLALTQSGEGHTFTKNERLIYQEIGLAGGSVIATPIRDHRATH